MLHLYEILQGYNLMESTGFKFTTQLYKKNICNLQVYDISITFSIATGFWVIVIAMSSNQVYNTRSQVNSLSHQRKSTEHITKILQPSTIFCSSTKYVKIHRSMDWTLLSVLIVPQVILCTCQLIIKPMFIKHPTFKLWLNRQLL